MLNIEMLNLPTVQYNAQRQHVDLDPGVPTSRLLGHLSAQITVVGANADAVVRDDMVQRLIPRLRLERDGKPIVDDIPLRDMYQLSLRNIAQEAGQNNIPTQTNLRAAGTYDVDLHFEIPFATRWNIRPWDVHLPPMRTRNALRLYVTWNTDAINAGDDAGTGAFISAGTDAYTWATDPTLTVVQVTHPRISKNSKPAGIRHYSQFATDVWASANPNLVERIQSGRKFDLHLLRMTYGAGAILEDFVNDVSFRSTRDTFLDEMSLAMLRAEEAHTFPAINGELGYLAIRWASGGRLSNIVKPETHPDLRYIFDVAAPTADDGVITITSAEVVTSASE